MGIFWLAPPTASAQEGEWLSIDGLDLRISLDLKPLGIESTNKSKLANWYSQNWQSGIGPTTNDSSIGVPYLCMSSGPDTGQWNKLSSNCGSFSVLSEVPGWGRGFSRGQNREPEQTLDCVHEPTLECRKYKVLRTIVHSHGETSEGKAWKAKAKARDTCTRQYQEDSGC